MTPHQTGPTEDDERRPSASSSPTSAEAPEPDSWLPEEPTGFKKEAARVDEQEEPPWSVYDFVPADWSEHVESLARWKQSDLIANVPLVWLADSGLDPLTGLENDREDIQPVFSRHLKVTAIICSQTCDLGGTAPGDNHPFILLVPLVPSSSIPKAADRKLASEGKIGYLVRTLPPPVLEGPAPSAPSPGEVVPPNGTRRETWYADLRLIFPASKALLLRRTPFEGLATEKERLTFAETVALKFRRAALHEALSEKLPRALHKFVKENGHKKQAFAKVEQVRLLVLIGERLLPDRAQLYVITDGETLSDAEQEIWTRFQQVADELFVAEGIALGAMLHSDVNKLSAAKYRQSMPVRCELLGPANWF